MSEEKANVTDALVQGVKTRFKGDDTPVTTEMVADIWAQFLIVHEMMSDLTKLHSPWVPDEMKSEAFKDLTKNLQKSISHIADTLAALPLKTGGNNG
ncbi:hypothetical protein OIV19_20330 [Brucella sp. HL-2]|nr:hypothetical protein [Brucella sp. HL-2]MCV9909949.1 hypothetical protein [Brucella sp. HL-2]